LCDRASIIVLRAGAVVLWFFLAPAPAAAEWHIKPFAGLTFGGSTTFLDSELAAGEPNALVGVSGAFLGDIVGIEVDLGHGPGFFDSGNPDRDHLVLSSRVTTLTGNIVIALPRRLAEYTLRPYFVGGVGLMQVRIERSRTEELLNVASNLGAIDLGGGVTGFLTDRLGLGWELRHVRSVGGDEGQGLSIGPEKLSFWRASMTLVIRY
jgi:hypothetical protein